MRALTIDADRTAAAMFTSERTISDTGVRMARSRHCGGVYDTAIDAILTERLILRPFDAGDLAACVAYRHRVIAQADDRSKSRWTRPLHLGFRCEARLVEADWFKGEWTTLRIVAVLDRAWRSGTTA